mgnify:FL=1
MVLPCGHSICKNCLYSLTSPECPTCRDKFQPFSIGSFPCNFALMDVLPTIVGTEAQIKEHNNVNNLPVQSEYLQKSNTIVGKEVSIIQS